MGLALSAQLGLVLAALAAPPPARCTRGYLAPPPRLARRGGEVIHTLYPDGHSRVVVRRQLWSIFRPTRRERFHAWFRDWAGIPQAR